MTTMFPTIPEGLDLVHTSEGVIVRKVWLNWKVIPLALFAIAWDSFLFFWYSQAFSKPNPQLMAVLFPIGHVAVGIGITYFVLASLVNRTDVMVSPMKVRIFIGPAPWAGNKEVGADTITEVLVRERSGNRGSKTFNVMYADVTRREIKLVGSLAEFDQANFIAVVIRQVFGRLAEPA